MELVFYDAKEDVIFIYGPALSYKCDYFWSGAIEKMTVSATMRMQTKNIVFLGPLSPKYKEI